MELSLDQFFGHIRNWLPYTSLEMHNKIGFYTDNFNLSKLNLLKNDFKSFLGFERSRFLKRFSIEDINKAILKFNSDKEEKIVYENLLSDEKLDLIEKLLCPNEFYACYRFLDTLIAEIEDQQGSSIHDLKTQLIKNENKYSKEVNQSSSKTKKVQKEIILRPTSFNDIFLVPDWHDLINVLAKLEPPLIDKDLNFIGKKRGGKGIICCWILTLINKGKINSSIKRQFLAEVLNKEIKNLNLGLDGSTFSKVNHRYDTEWEEKLLKLANLLP